MDDTGRMKWGGGRVIAFANAALTAPAIAPDRDGGFFVVWHSSDPAALLLSQYIDSKNQLNWHPLGQVVTTQPGSHPQTQSVLFTTGGTYHDGLGRRRHDAAKGLYPTVGP